jgi:integrase
MRRPVIHLLKETRPRQGFFEEHQFQAVRKHLPEDLQVAVTIMWLYGWRRSEVMALQLSQIDLGPGRCGSNQPRRKTKMDASCLSVLNSRRWS